MIFAVKRSKVMEDKNDVQQQLGQGVARKGIQATIAESILNECAIIVAVGGIQKKSVGQ